MQRTALWTVLALHAVAGIAAAQTTVDDTDHARVVYYPTTGNHWVHDNKWSPGAYNRTVSWNKTAGHHAEFGFDGTEVTYLFTKAWNRGKAKVFIDWEERAVIDLYSPVIEWQSGFTISGLSDGWHTIQVAVTGDKHPSATDCFIDIDAFRYSSGGGGGSFDMADYVTRQPGSGHGPVFNFNSGERLQLQDHGGGSFLLVKNTNYEEFFVGSDYIRRNLDTSESDDPPRMYCPKDGPGSPCGVNWIPRHMSVGSDYQKDQFVQHYNKQNCTKLNSGYDPYKLILAAHYDVFTSIGGYTLNDVVEVVQLKNHGGGWQPFETFWYARGYGMVQWQSHHGPGFNGITSVGGPPPTPAFPPCIPG